MPVEAGKTGRLNDERRRILVRLEHWLEVPMLVLAALWLALTIAELTGDLPRAADILQVAIWGIFIAEFGLRFILAPAKGSFLARNWLTIIALAVPAFRILRVLRWVRLLRAARAVRGLRLVKVLGGINRGMRALGRSLRRRGFAYVVSATLIVTLVGAAGMAAFEDHQGGIESYADALWWTAMLMTTAGSEYWPVTAEGRVLAFLLALYAFSVFGYITATLASYFVDRDRGASGDAAEIARLRAEIATLRSELGPR